MTDLIRQQKKEAIEKLNKELDELKLDEVKNEVEDAQETNEEEETQAKLEKPKRPRSEKQIKQFELVRQRKMAEAGKRKIQREAAEKEAKEQLEKQLIEKAIKLKKKQINRMKVIEQLSDDDEPVATKAIAKPKPITIVKAPAVIDPYEAFRQKFKIIK